MKTSSPISVGFISLGCAKNLVDSQIMAGVLVAENIQLAPVPEEADVVIVNTCSFIADAREESVETILSICELKNTGSCKAVLVTGCLPQRYKEKLKETFPDVDAFIGLDELEEVAKIIRKLVDGEHDIIEISESSQKLYEPKVPGLVFSTGRYAYLKVAEGCNHQCAFCAIPGIRGRHRSRGVDKLVNEAKVLIGEGFKELDLISQDVTAYGEDLPEGINLATLLRTLSEIDGNFWIRLLYGYPSKVTDELLQAMAELPKVCNYLDIPIQHSHEEVLRAMGRANTVKPVQNMVERIRGALPDAVIRTTCLVGFPGETDEHFEHLLEFVKKAEFDHLGAFTFSPEEHTRAFDMENCPDPEVAEERRQILLEAQREIVDKKLSALVDTEAEVLLERVDQEIGCILGRSKRHAPEVDGDILVEGAAAEDIGNFVKVRYTEQLEYDMKAVTSN